jgi:hypothetical protein
MLVIKPLPIDWEQFCEKPITSMIIFKLVQINHTNHGEMTRLAISQEIVQVHVSSLVIIFGNNEKVVSFSIYLKQPRRYSERETIYYESSIV